MQSTFLILRGLNCSLATMIRTVAITTTPIGSSLTKYVVVVVVVVVVNLLFNIGIVFVIVVLLQCIACYCCVTVFVFSCF